MRVSDLLCVQVVKVLTGRAIPSLLELQAGTGTPETTIDASLLHPAVPSPDNNYRYIGDKQYDTVT